MKKFNALLFASVCSLAGFNAHADEPPAISVALKIERQPVRAALKEFSDQSGVQVLLRVDNISVEGVLAPKVNGELTVQEALDRLLSNSGLTYEFVNEKTVRIAPLEKPEEAANVTASPKPTRLAQSSSPSQGEVQRDDRQRAPRVSQDLPTDPEIEQISEVLVTGTHIRGAEPVVPVQVFTRDDFDKAGAATAQEFMATLPQNFGGSPSSDTSGDAIAGLPFDPGMGAAVNLRGVGATSTLVLVDGRRLAAAGRGDFADISMIPLAAVERIEVMTDGASALYGSDAVGGVVNFILRKDFSGAETRLRYGDTTQGGASQEQASQVLGAQWDSGGAVLSYDYLGQSPLGREDREFSANTSGTRNGPKALIPGEKRHSVGLFAKQELSSRITASANTIYSQRDGERWDWESGFVQETDVTRKQYGGGMGLGIQLGGSWHAQLNGSYDQGTLDRRTLENPTTGRTTTWDSTYDLWSTDVLVTGDVVPLPWGAIKMAAGASYREEALEYSTFRNGVLRTALESETLNVRSAYGELSIPFGEQGDRPRAPIVVSLSGRYDDYSTFGDTLDPTYGVRWTPLRSLSLYATYGDSFKAPTLFQSQQNPFFNSIVIADNLLPGISRGLLLGGNNSELTEQTATTFTAGMEVNLSVAAGLRARLNYFDIDYDDRIQSIEESPFTILEAPEYRTLVTLRGDLPDAEFDQLAAGYLSGQQARLILCPVPLDSIGGCAVPAGSVDAVLDTRLQNFAAVKVSGLDLMLSQDFVWGGDRLSLKLDTSYFLKFDEQLIPGSAARELLNTLYNPVDLRLRGSASWNRQRWGTTVSINHTDGYSTRGALLREDGTAMPIVSVDSWTTFDWVVSYTVEEDSGGSWLEGFGIFLNVSNLFDEDPPYVDDQYYGLGYDPANADPRGRMVALTVSKRW